MTPPRQTAEYHRKWRKDHPELVARHTARNAARKRALENLRRQYPDEFRRLYQAELAELAAADGAQ